LKKNVFERQMIVEMKLNCQKEKSWVETGSFWTVSQMYLGFRLLLGKDDKMKYL